VHGDAGDLPVRDLPLARVEPGVDVQFRIRAGLEFIERGALELEGIPGEWRLFALRTAALG